MRIGGFRSKILRRVRSTLFRRKVVAEALARQRGYIGQIRTMLPDACSTARAIDRGEPWEKIAQCAIDDGYVDFAEELSRFVETCLRRDPDC